MILRSLKSHRITVRKYQPARRFKLRFACLVAAAGLATAAAAAGATAQQPSSVRPQSGGLRPVPQMGHGGTTTAVSAPAHDPKRDGWDLKWRKSTQVAAAVPHHPIDQQLAPQDPFAEKPRPQVAPQTPVQTTPRMIPQPPPQSTAKIVARGTVQVSHLQVATAEPNLAPVSVHANSHSVDTALVVYPESDDGFQLPAPQQPAMQQPGTGATGASDFFDNPFGSGPDRSQNELRGSESIEPLPPPDRRPQLDNPPVEAAQGPSLGDMMRDAPPKTQAQPQRDREDSIESLPDPRRETVESPSDRDTEFGQFENPFNRDRDAQETERERWREEDSIGDYRGSQDELKKDLGLTCEEFRGRIASQTIDKVSLDISPPFRPDVISEKEYEKLKDKFNDNQEARQWRSIEGRPLASGRLVDLAYEKAVIETAYGTTEELSINRLSEPDLAYISQNWGLPKECLIEQVAYVPRNWQSTTMTWKASNLCHKPLYFEDVNLERYGHTRGPLWQPVVSSAHFFANIAVLPYKMGMHTPGECQYALGYYRPGNCAPWIKPPVPISLRGGLTQAAVMTGAFWLIP